MSDKHEANIWELSDLCTPWCVHVVATLRIAEHIETGMKDIADLAAVTGCDTYALHCILTHLVGKGVFKEITRGHFELNELARQLLNPAVRIGLDLNGIGSRLAGVLATLPTYVRTGKSAYSDVFGLPFWDDLNAHPDVAATFDDLIGPTGHGTPNPKFDLTIAWEQIKTIVDVGGGMGALLAEILRLRPHIRGTLVDQPRTIARAGETFRAAGVSERVTIIGQSFYDPLPAGADLYLLKNILSDCPNSEAKSVLTRCAQAARPNGRVVILGGVVKDNTPIPLMIEMVLLGGKHRTVSEMRTLAREAGLEVVATGEQPSGYFVTECVPTVENRMG